MTAPTTTIWKHLRTCHRFILAFLLIGGGAAPATAFSSEAGGEPPVRADSPSIVSHLQQQLQQGTPAQQEVALRDIVNLTTCTASCTVRLESTGDQPVTITVENATGIGTLIDLGRLVPDLRRVFERGNTDQLRLMALASLVGIGDEAEMLALTKSLSDQSERVQDTTRRAMMNYFTEVYPSLKQKADQNNGGLSLNQIRDAHLEKQRSDRKAAREARKAARKAVRAAKQSETGK